MPKAKYCLLLALLLFVTTADSQISVYNARADVTSVSLQEMSQRFLNFSPRPDRLPQIVQTLAEDPEVRTDTLINSTETTPFYFRAYHKTFNPFGLPLDSVRTILSEHFKTDKGVVKDTFYLFQTEGLATGEEAAEQLQAWFRQLHGEIKTSFYATYYGYTKKKDRYFGEGVTYFSVGSERPVLNLTWQRRNKNTVVICLSFYAYRNPH